MRNAKSQVRTACWGLVFGGSSLTVVFATTLLTVTAGCMVQGPGGTPADAVMLGSTVDEVNRQQEENAEAAKFVVYTHEFEINIPLTQPTGSEASSDGFEFIASERVRGFHLNPYGEDHVYQIAQNLLQQQEMGFGDAPMWDVVIERSETSKKWDTRHRYPVHFNSELDEARRRTVVAVLTAFGVAAADQLVVVSPAFSEGLDANEAAAAYSAAIGGGRSGGRGNNRSGGF